MSCHGQAGFCVDKRVMPERLSKAKLLEGPGVLGLQ